jgi:hypothetical protein
LNQRSNSPNALVAFPPRSGKRKPQKSRVLASLKFFRENVPRFDFQPAQDCFELVECDVMFTSLDAVKRRVRNAGLFCELSIRKAASGLSHEERKLSVQISFHPPKVAKVS